MGKPQPKESANEIRNVFLAKSMNDIETVALIAGGHAFGKTHGACKDGAGKPPNEDPKNPWKGLCGNGKGEDTFTSGFEFPWTTKPTKWDTEYIQNLFFYEWEHIKGEGDCVQWKVRQPKNSSITLNPTTISSGGTHNQSIGMLTSDIALIVDDQYRSIMRGYYYHIDSFRKEFKNAWYKFTTQDMGPRSRCKGNNVPVGNMATTWDLSWQYPLPKQEFLAEEDDFTNIKTKLKQSLERFADQSLGRFIRLAWQCSSTFRSTDYFGGCNGARIQYAPQKKWEVNKHLEETINYLKVFPGRDDNLISFADMIVLAGYVAIELSGGNTMKFCGGRVDAADSQGLKDWMQPIITASASDHSIELLKDTIRRSGLNTHEFIALYGGGYVIGDTSPNCDVGIYCKRGQKLHEYTELSNLFFQKLSKLPDYELGGGETYKVSSDGRHYFYHIDLEFMKDPELKDISFEYAHSNDIFLEAFARAWEKLSNLDSFDGYTSIPCDRTTSNCKY